MVSSPPLCFYAILLIHSILKYRSKSSDGCDLIHQSAWSTRVWRKEVGSLEMKMRLEKREGRKHFLAVN